MKKFSSFRFAFVILLLLSPIATFALSISSVNIDNQVSCNGSADGQFSVIASGNIGDTWYALLPDYSDRQRSNVFSGLIAGTYSVYIQDDISNVGPSNVTITEPTALQIDTHSETASVCNNGSIEVIASGGTVPYVYSLDNFSNFQSSNRFSDLISGSYTIYVKDANGCQVNSAINSIIIDNQSLSIVNPPISTPTTCYGYNNGSTFFDIRGGIQFAMGNSYQVDLTKDNISFPITNITFTDVLGNTRISIADLPSGVYAGTVTDNSIGSGCSIEVNFNISEPSQVNTITQNITAVSCFGGENGSFDLNITGGTAPYTVACSDPGFRGIINTIGNTSNVSNLSANIYNIQVTDASSCPNVQSVFQVEITEPIDAVSYTPSTNPVECFGSSTGTIFGTATGGNIPYTYSISNNAAPLTAGNAIGTFENLPAGTYTAIATDNNGCTAENTAVEIGTPEELSYESPVNNPAATVVCEGDATASVSFTIKGREEWVDPTDTASYYSVVLYYITELEEVIVPDLTYSNSMHPVLRNIYTEYEAQIDPITGDSIRDADSIPIFDPYIVIDTLWDEGCHEESKELEITDYTADKKGFDCDDYVSITALKEGAYRAEFYKGNCQIGANAEFSVGRTGDVPVILLNGVDPICDASSTTISADITSTPGTTTYLWTLDGIEVGTARDLTKTYIIDETQRMLKLEASNQCGTSISNEIKLIVKPRPTAVLETEEEFLCEGQSTVLGLSFSGTAPFSYELADGTTGIVMEAYVESAVSPIVSEEQTVTALTDKFCTATIPDDITPTYITVYPEPDFDLEITVPELMVSGRRIEVVATEGFVEYALSLNGTPLASAEASNIYRPREFAYGTSNNEFDLSIVDTNGCSWEMLLNEEIVSETFPNIFTPNADGVNDVFLAGYNLKVFNRHGTLLYDGTEGWDAIYLNKVVNAGVYLYTVEVEDEAGEVYIIKNTVTVEK